MSQVFKRLPFLQWPRPTAALARREVVAGLTVGLMVIPQAVAYAALAGMPLITGIYASMLPALIAVLFSASSRLSVGPTALTATLVSASLTGLAEPGSASWVNQAVWLCIFTGSLQLLLGFARFGWLLNLVSSPVLTGFTQAAAVYIILSQIPALLGMPGNWGSAMAPSSWNLNALEIGVISLMILMAARRWRPTFPTVLVVVISSSLASQWLGLPDQPDLTIGTLPQGLPDFYVPSVLSWEGYTNLALPALAITLVSFLETASSAKVDNDQAGKTWDQDQDLIGQGLAKLASGFCGAFPTSSSFSRSALNLYAGAQTGWATVVSVGLIWLGLVYLTPVLQPVPQSVLAAIVIVAVLGLIKPKALLQIHKVDRIEASTALITFTVTLLCVPRLYWGVLAGILAALCHFLYVRMHPRIIEVGLHPDGSLRDRHLWHLPALAPHLYALRMDAALDFAAAAAFEKNIVATINAQPDIQHICLFAVPINRIDLTGTETISKLEKKLQALGITLHISGMKLPVETVLRRAGCLKPNAYLKMYRTDTEALAVLRNL
jgi:SulP family sulfate permease